MSRIRVPCVSSKGLAVPTNAKLNVHLQSKHLQRGLINTMQKRHIFGSSWQKPTATDDKTRQSHFERRLLPFSPEQVYLVVAGVDKYKEFVPYCKDSKVLRHISDKELEAELLVGFGPVEERYTSIVTLDKPRKLSVRQESGCAKLLQATATSSNLFHYLSNTWEFENGPNQHSCWTSFSVSFRFRSELHRALADMFFAEVQKRMLNAFEERCELTYRGSATTSQKITEPKM